MPTEQDYSIGQHVVTPPPTARTVISGPTGGVRVGLIRDDWPAGPVVTVTIVGVLNGQPFRGPSATFSGGPEFEELPVFLQWGWPGERHPTIPLRRRALEILDVAVQLDVLQPIRTAVSIEFLPAQLDAPAALSFVNDTGPVSTSANNASNSGSFPLAPVSSNRIFALVSTYGTNFSAVTFNDDHANVWSKDVEVFVFSANPSLAAIGSAPVTVTGHPFSITLTHDSSAPPYWEWIGVQFSAVTGGKEQSASAQAESGTSLTVTAPAPNSQPDMLVLAVLARAGVDPDANIAHPVAFTGLHVVQDTASTIAHDSCYKLASGSVETSTITWTFDAITSAGASGVLATYPTAAAVAAPNITSVTPDTAIPNADVDVILDGVQIAGTTLGGASPVIAFSNPDVTVEGTPVITATLITLDVRVAAAAVPNVGTVSVTTVDGTDSAPFSVLAAGGGGGTTVIVSEGGGMEYVPFGTTNKVDQIFIRNSSTGQGLAGLTNASFTAGCFLALRRSNEATCRYYTGADVVPITTLGSWVNPGANKIGFKEIDAVHKPGYYEVQYENTVLAGSGAQVAMDLTWLGVTNMLQGQKSYALFDPLTAQSVEDEVLNALSSAHLTAGSIGEKISQIGPSLTAVQVENAVLNAATSGHVTAGSVGEKIGQIVTAVGVENAVLNAPSASHVAAGSVGQKISQIPATPLTAAAVETAVLDAAASSHNTAGTIGAKINQIDGVKLQAILSLLDDPRTEPGTGAPPVNPDMATKIDYLYKAWRNRATQSASAYTLYNSDAVTAGQNAAVSDDGTTFDRGAMG